MDIQMKNRALSALKTLTSVDQVMPLVMANAKNDVVDSSINSFATLYKAKITKTFALETEVRELLKDTLSVFDEKEIDLYFQQGREVVKSITELKTGSINLPQYSLAVFSSGVKLDKVGAKSNLKVKLDASTEIKIAKSRFISEFISYSLFELDTYNSIMNRVFIIDKSEEVKEVFISDFFLKTALIQEAGISLDTLLANPSYILVLELRYNKLRVVKHPMLSESTVTLIQETFGKLPTFTEPSKANVGYVGFNVDLKGMAVESNDRLFSFLDPKKFAARQEKLNGDNSIARVWEDVFVITESGDKSLPYFNTGCFYASDRLLRSIGCCRLTSDINNLLIKGVTHYAPLIAKDAGMDLSIVASSSAKGGVVGITASLGQAFNFASEVNVLPQFDVCEITLNNGDTVKGVKVRVELKITNAFTVENFWRNTEVDSVSSLEEAHAASIASKTEKVVGYNKDEVKALSAQMMERAVSTNTSIIDVLCDAERNLEISLKPAVTTVTPGEFENISVTYGREVSRLYMDSLLANRFNEKMSAKTISASQWLTADVSGNKLSVNTIMEVVNELAMYHGVTIDIKPVSTYNIAFIKHVVESLGLQENGWIQIPELNVWLPTGETLFADLYSEANEFSLTIQVTAVMKYLLSSVMYLLTVQKAGSLNDILIQATGINLHAFIQDALLNKKTAKLKTHGKYMTLLPGFWLENKSDVCILSRDLYRPDLSHLEWVKVNMAKHPVLFLEAVAGFRCFNTIPGVELDNDLLSVFMNVVFVHPDYLLELQNDTDGDLARVTFDQYWLPTYTGKVLESCASEFHKNYMEGENDLGININKLPSIKSFSHDELYKAIAQASEAKENVAMFTDNLHKLQAGIRTSPITKQVMAVHGKEKGGQLLKDAVIMTATLIQTDAMNAIKHSGGVTAGSSLTSTMLRAADDVDMAKEAVVKYLAQHKFTYAINGEAEMFADIVVDLFASIHVIDMNMHKPHLTNQIERLTFKNQPNEVILVDNGEGKLVPTARRLDLFGMYKNTFNVTGDNSMFVELVQKFFGRK